MLFFLGFLAHLEQKKFHEILQGKIQKSCPCHVGEWAYCLKLDWEINPEKKSYRKWSHSMFLTSQSEASSVSNVRRTYFALITDREHSRIRELSLAGRERAVTSHPWINLSSYPACLLLCRSSQIWFYVILKSLDSNWRVTKKIFILAWWLMANPLWVRPPPL